ITGHLDGSIRRGGRHLNKPLPYDGGEASSSFASDMRTWPGFGGDGTISDHVIRSLSDRDYRLFRQMKHGDDYPAAHRLAESLFLRALRRHEASGSRLSRQSKEYKALRSSYVPPYDHTKFPNKWRKMEPD